MRLLSFCSMVIVVGLAACSDDGVPADSTGTDSGASTGSASNATSPSTTSVPTGTGTTDEPGTTSVETTSGGSESTFGPEESGTTAEPTDTESTTEPTSTSDSSSSGSSSSGSGTESSSGTESGSSDTGGPGPGEVGAACEGDMQCDSGVCWDWSDYDMFCFGAVCSVPCMGDDECVAAFTEAGAPYPENVMCGDDDRCIPLESGFGSWACADKR